MPTGLFLHYGPGGNAGLERSYFKTELPNIDFWDQDLTQRTNHIIENLVQQSIKQKNLNPNGVLLGHSFGCDLISEIIKQSAIHSGQIIVLISPILNIQKAFFQLAKNLVALENLNPQDQSHSQKIKSFISEQSSTQNYLTDPHLFWTLCGLVSEHPLYNQIFWASNDSFLNIQKILTTTKSLDLDFWQKAIHEYLFTLKKEISFDLKSNIYVVFGDKDPYLELNTISSWTESLGKDRIFTLKNAGHFPHIEQKSEFLKVLSKILENDSNSMKL